MTANRALMDELGFALKHDGKEWLVIEDGADDRCATITERVLWEALIEALAASVAPAEPIGEVKRSHFGGRTRNIGFDSVVMYEGAKVSPGDKVYAAPAAPANPTHLRRADGTLSGVFVEPVASEAAAVAADLRNWLDFLPGHAQPTIEQAVRLLETRP